MTAPKTRRRLPEPSLDQGFDNGDDDRGQGCDQPSPAAPPPDWYCPDARLTLSCFQPMAHDRRGREGFSRNLVDAILP